MSLGLALVNSSWDSMILLIYYVLLVLDFLFELNKFHKSDFSYTFRNVGLRNSPGGIDVVRILSSGINRFCNTHGPKNFGHQDWY